MTNKNSVKFKGVKDFLTKFIKDTSKIAEYSNEVFIAETIVNQFIGGLK